MKKALVIGLVLALGLAVGLVGCGGASTTTTAAATQAPVALKFACHYQQTEPGGTNVQKFCDYVTQHTNNAITFNVYYGGTLGNPGEELDLVSTGSVDMTVLGHLGYADQLPLLNFCGFLLGKVQYDSASTQAAIDYFNTLCFKDSTTSPLIQAEATAKNIKYLGFTAGGEDVFLAKFAFTGVNDLKGHKFGNAGSEAAWEALGLNYVQAFPPDVFQDLQRGVIDCTEMGFAPTVANQWYTEAPHYMWDGMYAAGNPYTINLATWNKLTPATQKIFMDAAAQCATSSVTDTDQETTTDLATLQTAKVNVGALSDADAAAVYAAYYKAVCDDMYGREKKVSADAAANMATVLQKAASLAGQTWAPPTS